MTLSCKELVSRSNVISAGSVECPHLLLFFSTNLGDSYYLTWARERAELPKSLSEERASTAQCIPVLELIIFYAI